MRGCFLLLIIIMIGQFLVAQSLTSINIDKTLKTVTSFSTNENLTIPAPYPLPLFSWELNGRTCTTTDADFIKNVYNQQLSIQWSAIDTFNAAYKMTVVFKNISTDTLTLANVVPFGRSEKHPYITGLGDHELSRSHLFLPGKAPVNVILPDNAWELGYSGISLSDDLSVYGLTRRKKSENAERHRFETILFPSGTVIYEFYADTYRGDWQEGLRKVFQEKYLFDLPAFDNTLYERADLNWIRDAYVMHLIQCWDNWFYDYRDGKYHLEDFEKAGKKLYGGDDVIGIWPTWPALGIDQRNQWDLFRDLPGGLPELNRQATLCRNLGTKFFICYNPWDESTRAESHTAGMATLIKAIGADGVVLDTRGESSRELQAAADSVRTGVILYSEGMAVPKNMPGIVSGRVHNALYYPPMLNLNKLIKPEFAIFRVAELYLEPIRREFNVSFFNGYGTELNVFRNGKPTEWMEEQYRYWGSTARILRENSDNFHSLTWTPLIQTTVDKIYANRWNLADKAVYTIYSILPEGYSGSLFEVDSVSGFHYVDLWNHRELTPEKRDSTYFLGVEIDAFNKSWLGTNNEGAVSCVARFPELLTVELDPQADRLIVSAIAGTIKVWAGSPAYDKEPLLLNTGNNVVYLSDHFRRYEGKFVVQLFDNQKLTDEKIVEIKPGTPRKLNRKINDSFANTIDDGMIKIPPGLFKWETTHGDDWVFYPDQYNGKELKMASFYMDKYPVTNRAFKSFMEKSGYQPADTANFLKHWIDHKIPVGMENYPVVYVSLEDAEAYARWAGKRIPTELEWQYAAQYPDGRPWPWGSEPDSTRCNPGNGVPDPTGKYPSGANRLGIEDLVGNVWQLTSDVYQNGSYTYIILKGGSYFKPLASWWYVQGGPQLLTHRQQLLRINPGFERNATVGFRCVGTPGPNKRE